MSQVTHPASGVSSPNAGVNRQPRPSSFYLKVGGGILAIATAGGLVGGLVAKGGGSPEPKTRPSVIIVPTSPSPIKTIEPTQSIDPETVPLPAGDDPRDIMVNVYQIRYLACTEGKPELLAYAYTTLDGPAYDEDKRIAEQVRDGTFDPIDCVILDPIEVTVISSTPDRLEIEYTYAADGVDQPDTRHVVLHHGDDERWREDSNIEAE